MSTEKNIKLFVLDVDGTLTNGKIFMDGQGNEFKAFNTQDGFGLRLLSDAGIKVAIISGRSSTAVEARCREISIDEVHLGVEDKFEVLSKLMTKFSVTLPEVAFMGDDIPDLPLIRQAGFSFAPANARQIVKDFANAVTASRGGDGAVAEACEHLLRQQGLWDDQISKYL